MLPEGKYKARAVEGALGVSSNGNPQVAVCFEIIEGEHQGEKINWYGSFSKNRGQGSLTPFERTIKSLRLCGWQGDDVSELHGIADNEVSIEIEHAEWKGEIQAKVKWVNAPGGLALTSPMNDAQAKAFAAKMRGDIVAVSQGAKAAPVAQKRGVASAQSAIATGDDDTPF